MIIVDAQPDTALKNAVAATTNARRPIVCFTEDSGCEGMHAAIEAGVSAYVVAGLSVPRLKAMLDVVITRLRLGNLLASIAPRSCSRAVFGLVCRELIDLLQNYDSFLERI